MSKPIYEKDSKEYFLSTKTTVIEDLQKRLQKRVQILEDSNNDLKEEITKLKIEQKSNSGTIEDIIDTFHNITRIE